MDAFARVKVDYVVQGGARIFWEMNRHFIDPGPYSFQLQIGRTGVQDADDWIDLGTPVVDTYQTFDPDQRIFGKTQDVHYRLMLTTLTGVYTSMIADTDGLLIKRDWINYREITRKEMLRHRVHTSINGFLLKVRRYGPRCLVCTDPLTEEVRKTNCPDCYGTGFQFGYFEPLPATYADVSLQDNREHRNPQVGMEKQDVISARFIGDPQLYSYDVWVNAYSDERHYMHKITEKAHVRGVPLIYDAELRLAPFTDVVYTVPIIGANAMFRQSVQSTTKAEPCHKIKPQLNYLADAFAELRERRARSSRR